MSKQEELQKLNIQRRRLRKKKDYKGLIITCKEYIDRFGDEPKFLLDLADAYYNTGDIEKCNDTIHRISDLISGIDIHNLVIKYSTRFLRYYKLLAKINIDSENYIEAEKYIELYKKVFPEDDELDEMYLNISYNRKETLDWKEIYRFIKQISDKKIKPDIKYRRITEMYEINNYINEKKYKKAITELNKIFNQDSDNFIYSFILNIAKNISAELFKKYLVLGLNHKNRLKLRTEWLAVIKDIKDAGLLKILLDSGEIEGFLYIWKKLDEHDRKEHIKLYNLIKKMKIKRDILYLSGIIDKENKYFPPMGIRKIENKRERELIIVELKYKIDEINDEDVNKLQSICRGDDKISLRAVYLLAIIFIKKGQSELAKNLYEVYLKIDTINISEFHKVFYYQSGLLFEKSGLIDIALKIYTILLSRDIDIFDVKFRYEKLKKLNEVIIEPATAVLPDRYKDKRVIDCGGMGTVYFAVDRVLDRPVAIKVLEPKYRKNYKARERFLREAKILANLQVDGVVEIYDIIDTKDELSIVMEFLQGFPLSEIIQRDKNVSEETSVRWMKRVAEILYEVHKRGIIHRDLKPDNIMLLEGEKIKILDFGLAHLREESGLTESGDWVGTRYYMSPEQILGEPVDERTDIYQWGCTLYHLVEGVPPFKSRNVEREHLKASVEFNSNITDNTKKIILKCMQKQKRDRFKNMKEITEIL